MVMPLEGLLVLDLTRLAPGPYCTMILGDLGADVLRVEEPSRLTGRRAEQAAGVATDRFTEMQKVSPYSALQRNKRSLVLNLKAPEGKEIFYKLVTRADVLVEEYRPGVSQRLGIDYDTLKGINPRLVYCAITGYGQTGPYRNLVGHDINYIALAGALSAIGDKGGAPVIPLNLLGDFAGGGMMAALGVMAALMARDKTGRGQFVDISMTDGVMSILTAALSTYFETGVLPKPGAESSSGGAHYYDVYATKDGKYISIGCVEPWFYANLCRAVGREDLLPHQYVEGQKKEEMFRAFREVFASKTRDEWFDILRQEDIAVGRVLTFDELTADPQVQARQMVVQVPHAEGTAQQVGIPTKLSETPGAIRRLPPTKGQHTEEVLRELGYYGEGIDRLRQQGVVE